MKKVIFISLGRDCIPAYHLKKCGLREQALPFDWVLTEYDLGIENINKLISNEFDGFLENLKYNKRGKVIDKNYPNLEFFHQDIIKNKKLRKSLKKRIKIFLNLLKYKNKIIFIYFLRAENGFFDKKKLNKYDRLDWNPPVYSHQGMRRLQKSIIKFNKIINKKYPKLDHEIIIVFRGNLRKNKEILEKYIQEINTINETRVLHIKNGEHKIWGSNNSWKKLLKKLT